LAALTAIADLVEEALAASALAFFFFFKSIATSISSRSQYGCNKWHD
jgi:hypothetical protein